MLLRKGAIVVFDQAKSAAELSQVVIGLAKNAAARESLAKQFMATAKPNASEELATIIIRMAEQGA